MGTAIFPFHEADMPGLVYDPADRELESELCVGGSARTWSSSEMGIFLCATFLKRTKMLNIKPPMWQNARNTLMGMKCKKSEVKRQN